MQEFISGRIERSRMKQRFRAQISLGSESRNKFKCSKAEFVALAQSLNKRTWEFDLEQSQTSHFTAKSVGKSNPWKKVRYENCHSV
jgi:hypothetical protein